MFCLKSGIKISKIQKPSRNIPRNNVLKDNRTLFLNVVTKAPSGYAKKSRIATMLDDIFHDLLLGVTNFERKEMEILIS